MFLKDFFKKVDFEKSQETPRTRVCAIYRTPFGCYKNWIISYLFIYPSPRSEEEFLNQKYVLGSV